MHLHNQGPKTKLQLMQLLTPQVFKRLEDLDIFEVVDDPDGAIISMYRVKDEFCEQ